MKVKKKAAQPHNCQMTVPGVTRVTLMISQSVSLQVTVSCIATCCQVTSLICVSLSVHVLV